MIEVILFLKSSKDTCYIILSPLLEVDSLFSELRRHAFQDPPEKGGILAQDDAQNILPDVYGNDIGKNFNKTFIYCNVIGPILKDFVTSHLQ